MRLSESLVWALSPYGISGVKVTCDDAIRDEVSKSFLESFTPRWNEALDAIEEEYGECEAKEEEYFPVRIEPTDYGFFIKVGALEIEYDCGDYYDDSYGVDAFDYALKSMKREYRGIKYEGYIGRGLSAVHSGIVSQWEISSQRRNKNEEVVYDFVGSVLNSVLNNEKYIPEDPAKSAFWCELAEQLECSGDFEETIKTLYAYSRFVDKAALDRGVQSIIDIADTIDEDKHEELTDLVKKLEAGA